MQNDIQVLSGTKLWRTHTVRFAGLRNSGLTCSQTSCGCDLYSDADLCPGARA